MRYDPAPTEFRRKALESCGEALVMPDDSMHKEAEALAGRLTEIRRDLHRHPELGFREVRTAKKISEALSDLGIEHRTGVATTGILATIRGSGPGRTVALRADMDALPIEERT